MSEAIFTAELASCKPVPSRNVIQIVFEADQATIPEGILMELQKYNSPREGGKELLRIMVMPKSLADDLVEKSTDDEPEAHRRRMIALQAKDGVFNKRQFWGWLEHLGYGSVPGPAMAKGLYKDYLGIESLKDLTEADFKRTVGATDSEFNQFLAGK